MINTKSVTILASTVITAFFFGFMLDTSFSFASILSSAIYVAAIIVVNSLFYFESKSIVSYETAWIIRIIAGIFILSSGLWIYLTSNAHINAVQQRNEKEEQWILQLTQNGDNYAKDSLGTKTPASPSTRVDSEFQCGIPIILEAIPGTKGVKHTFTELNSALMFKVRNSVTHRPYLEVLGEIPTSSFRRLLSERNTAKRGIEFLGILDTVSLPNKSIIWMKSVSKPRDEVIYNASRSLIYCPDNERCAPIEYIEFGRNDNANCKIRTNK